jgi:hypothetical protein
MAAAIRASCASHRHLGNAARQSAPDPARAAQAPPATRLDFPAGAVRTLPSRPNQRFNTTRAQVLPTPAEVSISAARHEHRIERIPRHFLAAASDTPADNNVQLRGLEPPETSV